MCRGIGASRSGHPRLPSRRVHARRRAGAGIAAERRLRRARAQQSAGYIWPEALSGLWKFEDNLAHNNVVAGIFVWQNEEDGHQIKRFTAYNNGDHGIIHGAYVNPYHYREIDLRDQPNAIALAAAGRDDRQGHPQSWIDVRGGALAVGSHNLPGSSPVLFYRSTFPEGVTLDDGDGERGPLDFVDCGLESGDFNVVSLNPDTVVRVQRAKVPRVQADSLRGQ